MSSIQQIAQGIGGILNAPIGSSPPWNPEAGGFGAIATHLSFQQDSHRTSDGLVLIDGRFYGVYATAEEAAIGALNDYNPKSRAKNKEYAGRICGTIGGQFIYSKPNLGEVGSVKAGYSPCPTGTTAVAVYHTHGAYSPRYASEIFSRADKLGANQLNLPSYLATPARKIKRFDPVGGANTTRGTVTILPGTSW